jgi:4-aminobutyrate--pyruvate transaminase
MPSRPFSNTQARDMASLLHPFTNLTILRETGPLVIERGQGVFVYGSDGKDYLEAMSGLWCTALGWGENELAETAARQMRELSFGHIFGGKSHEPGIALAEKLKEMAPMPVGKVFFANSGSEANDSQIKFMWYAANARGQMGRKKIIARDRAYHGVTLASASLTGLDAFHKSFDLPFDFTLRAECPHYYKNARDGESEEQYSVRLAADLDAMIQREGPGTIAAMFVEASAAPDRPLAARPSTTSPIPCRSPRRCHRPMCRSRRCCCRPNWWRSSRRKRCASAGCGTPLPTAPIRSPPPWR